jgi:hypothetical protein
MPSIDVLAVNLSIQLLIILLVTSKSLVTVGNVKTTIQGSLQQQKDFTSGAKPQTELNQKTTCYKRIPAYFKTKNVLEK